MPDRADIEDALFLTEASYSATSDDLLDFLLPSNWAALGSEELGMSGLQFGVGIFDSNYLFDSFSDQGFVASNSETISISFTGTSASWLALLPSQIETLQDWATNLAFGSAGWDLVAAAYNGLFDAAVSFAQTVRRQGFWHHRQLKLRESSAHLVGFIMRHVVCDASVAFRAFFV